MSTKWNGSEFIEIFAQKADMTKKDARSFMEAFSDIITDVAISEGKANVSGFGKFSVTQVADREGTQPGTGETIIIPAHRKMSFSPYKKLEELVNNTTEKGHKTMKNESNAFAALLDETEAQSKRKTKDTYLASELVAPEITKKNPEFKPVELESNDDLEDLDEKTALLDELEYLIIQKKFNLQNKQLGSSLDVRIQDDDQTEAASMEHSPENSSDKPNVAPVSESLQEKSKNGKFLNDSISQQNQYVMVDTDLFKVLIESMEELKEAISSLGKKSKRLEEPSEGVIQIDRKWFVSGGIIGAIVLFLSGFFLGISIDVLNSTPRTPLTMDNLNTAEKRATVQGTAAAEETSSNPTIIIAAQTNKDLPPTQRIEPNQTNNSTRTIRFNSEMGLYNMASEIYGNPRLWVLLFEENFTTAQNPDDIPENAVLTIPRIAQNGLLTNLERERLRIALLHVAQAYENAGKSAMAQSYRNASVYYPNTM